MRMEEFYAAFSKGGNNKRIDDLANKWDREKFADDFLGTPVLGGVVLADILMGDGLRDQISSDLLLGFWDLMGEKADTYDKVRNLLLEKLENGGSSVNGLINKIKGQIGENEFVQHAGSTAHLAASGSQEAWDVAINHGDGTFQYVQVKMSDNPNYIINGMEKVQAKLDDPNHLIVDEFGEKIAKIDFAVPSNIVDEVKRRASELGLDNIDVLSIKMTAEDAAKIVEEGVCNVGPESMMNFFGELLGDTLTATALHGIVNGFVLYKGSKDAAHFFEDTAVSALISGGGIASGMVVENVLRKMSFVGGVPAVTVLAASLATRMFLKRIADRRHFVDWIAGSVGKMDKTILAVSNV